MDRIADANTNKLSGMIQRIQLTGTPPTNELLSTGTDLYIKTGSELFTCESSHLVHQQNAVNHMQTGLALEYGLTREQAEPLLRSVFTDDRVTAGGAVALQTRSDYAASLIEGKVDKETAFIIGAHVQELVNCGISAAEAERIGRGWALRLKMTNTPAEFTNTLEGIVTGAKYLAGKMTLDQAVTHLRPEQQRGFFSALKDVATTMPRCHICGDVHTAVWLKIALACGQANFIPEKAISRISLNCRVSMVEALSSDISGRRIPNNISKYKALARLHRTINENELVPKSEQVKTREFYFRLRGLYPGLQTRWPGMTQDARVTALRNIAMLHADVFEQAPPTVIFPGLPPDPGPNLGDRTGGSYNFTTNVLKLNPRNLEDFARIFNTVVHESTHAYQNKVVHDMRGGRIPVGDDRYHQARLMTANRMTRMNGMNRYLGHGEAYPAYRFAPNERHAFNLGQRAAARHRIIFG